MICASSDASSERSSFEPAVEPLLHLMESACETSVERDALPLCRSGCDAERSVSERTMRHPIEQGRTFDGLGIEEDADEGARRLSDGCVGELPTTDSP